MVYPTAEERKKIIRDSYFVSEGRSHSFEKSLKQKVRLLWPYEPLSQKSLSQREYMVDKNSQLGDRETKQIIRDCLKNKTEQQNCRRGIQKSCLNFTTKPDLPSGSSQPKD